MASASTQDVFILDFFTQRGDESLHGTLSLIDGTPKSTWTSQAPRGKKTYDTAVTETQFRSTWDRIFRLAKLNDFAVKHPDTKMSFTDHYVIAVVYSFPGGQGQRNYLIPYDCKSEEVANWVAAIEACSKVK
jgi:hypothetical protein